MFNVAGKRVLVVGAGGLGTTVAMAFACNGAVVAVASRSIESLHNVEQLINEDVCKLYQMDVTDRECVNETITRISDDIGGIDILVYTAAIAPLGNSLTFDDTDFRRTLDINFMGAYYVNVAAAKIMAENGWGRIINISSIDAFSVNCVDDLPYSASKSAMSAMVRHLAVDLAKSGVTVNAIAPVWIWTPMMNQRPNDYMVKAASTIPMGRCSYPQDYLGAIFFISSSASDYMTGQTLLVDGGWSVYRAFTYSCDS